MRFLIVFLLLTSICFAQEAWQYKSVVETWQDMTGKYRIKVLISNGKKEECVILKFDNKPISTQIKTEINKVCYQLNNPLPPKPTVEELKFIIIEKDKIIEDLNKQLKTK